jgi:hypothetical protein
LECDTQAANLKPTTGALGGAPKLGRGRAAAVLFEVRRAVFPDGNEPCFPLAGTITR